MLGISPLGKRGFVAIRSGLSLGKISPGWVCRRWSQQQVESKNTDLPPMQFVPFADLIRLKLPFVDKTEFIFRYASKPLSRIFIRPPKWGKSTFLSTFASMYQGGEENAALFENLLMQKSASPEFWASKRIVIQFNMSESLQLFDNVEMYIIETLRKYVKQLDLDPLVISIDEDDAVQALSQFLHSVAQKQLTPDKIAILIDDYDRPIIDPLSDVSTTESLRRQLSIKNAEIMIQIMNTILSPHEKHAFFLATGSFLVDRVDSNCQLVDRRIISLFGSTVDSLFGYSWTEIERYFPRALQTLCETHRCSPTKMRELMMRVCGGYSWTDVRNSNTMLFHPWNVHHILSSLRLESIWIEQISSLIPYILVRSNTYPFSFFSTEHKFDSDVWSLSASSLFQENHLRAVLLFYGFVTTSVHSSPRDETFLKLRFPNDSARDFFSKTSFHNLLSKASMCPATVQGRVLKFLEDGKIICLFRYLSPIIGRFETKKFLVRARYGDYSTYFILFFSSLIGSDRVKSLPNNSQLADSSFFALRESGTWYVFEIKIHHRLEYVSENWDCSPQRIDEMASSCLCPMKDSQPCTHCRTDAHDVRSIEHSSLSFPRKVRKDPFFSYSSSWSLLDQDFASILRKETCSKSLFDLKFFSLETGTNLDILRVSEYPLEARLPTSSILDE